MQAMPYTVAEPRLKRSITIQLKGDWGQANLHRICGWLSQEILGRTGPFSRGVPCVGVSLVNSADDGASPRV
jgi:hypothetical protein